jgi:plastocyanin
MTIPTKLSSLVALGFAAVLGLGACGGGGGDETAEAGRVEAEPAPEPTAEGSASPGLRVEADEFSFSPGDLRAAAGTIAIEYVNVGALEHTLVIDGVEGLKLTVPGQGDVDEGSITLDPGTYTVFCDVAGHRASGMEAQLTVG